MKESIPGQNMKSYQEIVAEVYDHGDAKKSAKLGFGKHLGRDIPKGHVHITRMQLVAHKKGQ